MSKHTPESHAMRLYMRAAEARISALLAVIKTPALDDGYRQRDAADRTISQFEAATTELVACIERTDKSARVIAAAHELLEALRILVGSTEKLAGTHGLALDNARAAIAKATGVES